MEVTLSQVLGYKHPELIARLQREMQLSEADALQAFSDLLLFLFVAGTTKEMVAPPSKRIDDAWHHFIVYMKDYEAFCHIYFGRILYHQPASTDTIFGEKEVDVVLRTVRYAEAIAGELSSNWADKNLLIYDGNPIRNWCCNVREEEEGVKSKHLALRN